VTAKKKPKGKKEADPRVRWKSTLAKDMPPGPQGQPGHAAGTGVQVVQVVTLPKLGRVAFAAPSPAQLLLSAARPHVKRAARMQKALPGQTTDRGQIYPFIDRRFTNDKAVLDFFEDAMAAVLLMHASLDSFANESLPEGFDLDQGGETLSREELERRGLELRLSRAVSTALGKPNLRVANPPLWQAVMQLKELRDDIAHMKSADAYSNQDENETIFARLLVVNLDELASAVEEVMVHYGDAPRSVEDQPDGGTDS
jgi:hypothetical protein